MKRLWSLLTVLFSIDLCISGAYAAEAEPLALAGYLHDKESRVIETGAFEFRLSFWNQADREETSGFKMEWEEIHPVVLSLEKPGYFELNIGTKKPLDREILKTYPFLQAEVRSADPLGLWEILDPEPENPSVDRIDFIKNANLFSKNIFVIQQTNPLRNEITLQFGDALSAFIQYNAAKGIFNISKNVSISGDLTVSGRINGRDLALDGALLDHFGSPEKMVAAINASTLKISAKNIDYSTADAARHYYSFDLSKDIIAYDTQDSGDWILLENGMIKVKEKELVSVYADYLNGDKIANKVINGCYSPADSLLYFLSNASARVYAVRPDTREIVHEIGRVGYGNGGIANAYDVEVSRDGLLMVVTSASHFASVWKRNSIQESWRFSFDLGQPNKYGNVSDGSLFWTPYSGVIRESDKHIFVGSYYGLTQNFNVNATGFGGVAEFDSSGRFIGMPLHIGLKGGDGQIVSGEARYVLGLLFDDQENLWVSTADNQIGRFDGKTWELQKTITSNTFTSDKLNSPYEMRLIEKDRLATRNTALRQIQIWSLEGRLIHSFGWPHQNTFKEFASPLGFYDLYGFFTDPEGSIYVMNYSNDNIQKIRYSAAGTVSRLIFPAAKINAAHLKKLVIGKTQEGEFNKIRFQYRLGTSDLWKDAPPDHDLSAIDFRGGEIQIAAVFIPDFKGNVRYTSDVVDAVQIEYE